MMTIDVSSLDSLHDLMTLLEKHSEIRLVQAEKAIARVISIGANEVSEKERMPDLHPNVWISPDFNSELPEKYWILRTI